MHVVPGVPGKADPVPEMWEADTRNLLEKEDLEEPALSLQQQPGHTGLPNIIWAQSFWAEVGPNSVIGVQGPKKGCCFGLRQACLHQGGPKEGDPLAGGRWAGWGGEEIAWLASGSPRPSCPGPGEGRGGGPDQ